MIGYLRGAVSHLYPEYCFIDVQGVGYRVYIPNSTRQQLALGSTVILFTYLNVREDALLLYGFSTTEEYELFLLLIAISGIGPKVALGVLSAMNPAEFRNAISRQNAALLTRIPGIGKKTAERMLLELKDKIGLAGEPAAVPGGALSRNGPRDAVQEALEALLALGYSPGEVVPVLDHIQADGLSVQDLIRLTLKEFGGR